MDLLKRQAVSEDEDDDEGNNEQDPERFCAFPFVHPYKDHFKHTDHPDTYQRLDPV